MLTVSNIAWQEGADPTFLRMVADAGFHGVDLAPTKIWPGWQIPADHGAGFRRTLDDFGLSAVGMQSLFFGAGPLNLFADCEQSWAAFLSHMDILAGVAGATGVARMVFGAPANRDPGNLSEDQAWNVALDRLRVIGDRFTPLGIQICMEPVPAAIGGKFLRSTLETMKFVRQVDHPSVRLTLDTAVLFYEAADIQRTIFECAELIGHVHASEPELGDFDHPVVNHQAVSDALKEVAYTGAVAIEMAAKPALEPKNLARALEYVGSVYA
jgi:D-psicose/D-tagatose/L-ribulose 3-epimerase